MVASQYAERMICDNRSVTSGCLDAMKAGLLQWNMFTMNLRTLTKNPVFLFDINEPLILTEIVQVIGMEGMMSCACLRYLPLVIYDQL